MAMTRPSSTKGSAALRTVQKEAVLEKIIGITSQHNSSTAVSPLNGDIAHVAGCIVTTQSSKRQTAGKYFKSPNNKALSAVAFSENGKYLAAGESGHQPAVLVWDYTSKKLLAQLKAHKHGVSCLQFAPGERYLISVGYQHDGTMIAWDWRAQESVANAKIPTKVYALKFTGETTFVTAGFRHVKFWKLETSGMGSRAVRLDGRAGLLGPHRQQNFVDCAAGKAESSGLVFCVTSSGILCQFNKQRLLDKWVDLKTNRAFAISISEKRVLCACTNGIVRMFNPQTLKYIATLPRPPPLGEADQCEMDISKSTVDAEYADVVVCATYQEGQRAFCIYSDRSMFIWDIKDTKKMGRVRSSMAHSGCVWDIELIPQNAGYGKNVFATSSADNTIRLWTLDTLSSTGTGDSAKSMSTISRNVFSKECLRIIYTETDFQCMKNNTDDLRASYEIPALSGDSGVRCMRASSRGEVLAAGDRKGNLLIYKLSDMSLSSFQEAHDSEILTVDISDSRSHSLVATGSRDRLIHVFDVNQGFKLSHTIDDHSSSITSVKFASQGSKLLSCGADKSVVFRHVEPSGAASKYAHAVVPHGTLYDLAVDVTSKFALTIGQDKRLNIWNTGTGKSSRVYRFDGDSGEPIKLTMDPSGIYFATCNSDKSIRVYDFFSGECLLKAFGHSEVVTGVRFTEDCQRLISVSSDGCIGIWKLPPRCVKAMKARLKERVKQEVAASPLPVPSAVSPAPRGTEKSPSISPIPMRATPTPEPTSPAPAVAEASPIASGIQTPEANASVTTGKADVTAETGRVPSPTTQADAGEQDGSAEGGEGVDGDSAPTLKFRQSILPAWAKDTEQAAPNSEQTGDGNSLATPAESKWAERIPSEKGDLKLFGASSESGEDTTNRRFTIEPPTPSKASWTQSAMDPSQPVDNAVAEGECFPVGEKEVEIVVKDAEPEPEEVEDGEDDLETTPPTEEEVEDEETVFYEGEHDTGANATDFEVAEKSPTTTEEPEEEEFVTPEGVLDEPKPEPEVSESTNFTAFASLELPPNRDENRLSLSRQFLKGSLSSMVDSNAQSANPAVTAQATVVEKTSPTTTSMDLSSDCSLPLESEEITKRSLSAEREALKLKEKQSALAEEVARTRDRLKSLGVSVSEPSDTVSSTTSTLGMSASFPGLETSAPATTATTTAPSGQVEEAAKVTFDPNYNYPEVDLSKKPLPTFDDVMMNVTTSTLGSTSESEYVWRPPANVGTSGGADAAPSNSVTPPSPPAPVDVSQSVHAPTTDSAKETADTVTTQLPAAAISPKAQPTSPHVLSTREESAEPTAPSLTVQSPTLPLHVQAEPKPTTDQHSSPPQVTAPTSVVEETPNPANTPAQHQDPPQPTSPATTQPTASTVTLSASTQLTTQAAAKPDSPTPTTEIAPQAITTPSTAPAGSSQPTTPTAANSTQPNPDVSHSSPVEAIPMTTESEGDKSVTIAWPQTNPPNPSLPETTEAAAGSTVTAPDTTSAVPPVELNSEDKAASSLAHEDDKKNADTTGATNPDESHHVAQREVLSNCVSMLSTAIGLLQSLPTSQRPALVSSTETQELRSKCCELLELVTEEDDKAPSAVGSVDINSMLCTYSDKLVAMVQDKLKQQQ